MPKKSNVTPMPGALRASVRADARAAALHNENRISREWSRLDSTVGKLDGNVVAEVSPSFLRMRAALLAFRAASIEFSAEAWAAYHREDDR